MELKELVKGYKEELKEIKNSVNEMYSDEDTKIYEDGDDYEEDVVSRPKKVKKNTRQKPRKKSRVNNFEDEDNEDKENKIWLVIGAAAFIIGLILLILGSVIIGGLIMTISIGAVVYILHDYNWFWKVVLLLLGLILISIGSLVGSGLLIAIGVLISVVTLLVIALSFII